MDRLEAMAAFAAVVDRGGFAAAARHLGHAPSAVTRQVAALEERLGVRLLARTTRSVALTDAGARYLERTRRILTEIEEAENSAQSERARPVGRLVVTAPSVFGRLHVAPLMAQFLRLHPEVTGTLTLADRMVGLVEEGVDCAIRIGDLPDSGLIARRLGETRRIVVASPAYLAARGEPRLPADVAAHDAIRFTIFDAQDEWRFRRDGAEERVPIQPRFVTNSADAVIWAAEHDGGLAMLLGYQAAAAVRAGRLRIVLAAFERPALPIQIVHPTSRLLSAKVRAFIETAASSCDWHFGGLAPYAMA